MDKETQSISLINNVDLNTLGNTLQRIAQFQELISSTVIAGRDIGIIPGSNKPSLLKPGAEKILMILGLTSRYEILKAEDRPDDGFVNYEIRCIISKNEQIITEGLGCCNSWENKYKTSNPYAVKNTLLKMAKKRAQVDAVLTVGSLSDLFTQDLEDMDMDQKAAMHLDETKHNQHQQQKQQKQQQPTYRNNNNQNNQNNSGSYQQSYTQRQQQSGQAGPGAGNVPGLFPGQKPGDKITEGMGRRLYAKSGYNESIVQEVLKNWGYAKREDIILQDYDLMVEEAEAIAARFKAKQQDALNKYS